MENKPHVTKFKYLGCVTTSDDRCASEMKRTAMAKDTFRKRTNTDKQKLKRQATFLGHLMRRGKLEHLVTTGKFEGKSNRGRQREKIMDGLATWLGPEKVSDTLAAVKDRDL
ncbi:hypothetical protein PoB_002126000 [Plakobranchus ocellatus]|uniref:Uncharacterized protein n=1 Tax=Plakobranchus ocellatus TaxID=259542 RepID=A0AAV3ZI02_9GAST|nr:hypothetical protein PoB_002126000 [Plakobranchus ocellatus]